MSLVLEKRVSRRAPARVPGTVIDRLYRFTVAQYHQIIADGALRESDRVELLDGLVVRKVTHNPPHDGTIQLVDEAVSPRLPAGWAIRIQSAIALARSEPEPDIAIVRGPVRRYLKAHPVPRDIGCLTEVAETSVDEDRDYKGPLYARALIPVYWLVNIPERQVEVYTEPRTGRKAGYGKRQDYGIGDTIPIVLDGREVDRVPVKDLLP